MKDIIEKTLTDPEGGSEDISYTPNMSDDMIDVGINNISVIFAERTEDGIWIIKYKIRRGEDIIEKEIRNKSYMAAIRSLTGLTSESQ